ncbi:hypothetical protein [Caulobacter sp. SSI4214]|uniref:hypothetical protein n=1 Tax=Caulobacter sp. SSI4214 TaxID=2575739 RepID=UPI0014387F7B|nr:hypothetical protein [Caulobacter sp. SSI4214]
MIKMKRLAVMLSLVSSVVIASPVSANPLSLLEFRALVRSAVEKRLPGAQIQEIDDRTLGVTPPGGGQGDEIKMMVEGAYGRYLNDPMSRDAVIDQLVRVTSTLNTIPAAKPDNVVILLRPSDYLANSGLGEIKALTRPFSEGFIEVIAVDVGETFRVGEADEVTKIFKNRDAIWARASENTRARNTRFDVEPLGNGGVWAISSDSSLAPFFVETPDVWAANGVTIKGDPIAVFLRRNLLLLADGGDMDLRLKLSIFLDNVRDDPETISTTMYIRHNGVWSALKQGP